MSAVLYMKQHLNPNITQDCTILFSTGLGKYFSWAKTKGGGLIYISINSSKGEIVLEVACTFLYLRLISDLSGFSLFRNHV